MKTREYIYPNPTLRAKMLTDSGISKLGVSYSIYIRTSVQFKVTLFPYETVRITIQYTW